VEKPKGRHAPRSTRDSGPGEIARAKGRVLTSCQVGVLPIIERLLQRMRLKEFLQSYLPRADRRCRIAPAIGITLLLKNVLISREPLYGVGEWAARYAPDVLGFDDAQLPSLNDDRIGRCLDRLFASDIPSLTLAVVAHVVREFDVKLDELHNDSTTITFHGAYADAAKEEPRGKLKERTRLAITWGHNKDHRPDLKQLLYILTVAKDGGVPVYFQAASGNVVDDQTHCTTWDLLRQLTARTDFLYVADCKLATAENMAYIHQRGGRFITVLPRTRKEDGDFRELLGKGQVRWRAVHEIRDEHDDVVDEYCVSEPESLSAEGYRVVWYRSTRKATRDAHSRGQQVERALSELAELRQKLSAPRTRYREEDKVAPAVTAILEERDVARFIIVEIEKRTSEKYHQAGRGRPSKATRYVKEESTRFDLKYRIDHEQLAAEVCYDGIFPLITNALMPTAQELLLAYKGQPMIEKRFSQLKTDFEVAPVYLKETTRIQALLCVYFFVLLTEALLERELRRAMDQCGLDSLPLYPEGRKCHRPTTRRLIDLFDDVQRHTLVGGDEPPVIFTTALTGLQRKLLGLLGMRRAYDG
jgi:transposase